MNKMMTNSAMTKLAMATIPTCPLVMTSSLLVIGAGTFGSICALELFDHVWDATNGALPQTTSWITIDADKDSRDPNSLAHTTGVRFLSTGKNGSGTVISKGYEFASKAFPDIFKTVKGAMTELAESRDSRFPVNLSPSENQTALIIAGDGGGTSGGTKDAVVTATHLASRHLGLSRFDVVSASCGSEMPWRDKERSVNPEVRRRIMANCAESALWRYNQMATLQSIKIPVPGANREMRQHASTRIAVNLEFDWQSESSKLSTNDQLIAMMASCLFQRFFTAMGCRRESRHCDDLHTGVTGQKHPISDEASVNG